MISDLDRSQTRRVLLYGGAEDERQRPSTRGIQIAPAAEFVPGMAESGGCGSVRRDLAGQRRQAAAVVPLQPHGHRHGSRGGQARPAEGWFAFWINPQHTRATFFTRLAESKTNRARADRRGRARAHYVAAIVVSLLPEGAASEVSHSARQRGCALVQLTIDKSRIDAHRFYERLGFVASHEE
jgi:hypothetical protein